jgi:2-furoyl-CoA dehydrogenase 2Fe-2S iron sulfur subunit
MSLDGFLRDHLRPDEAAIRDFLGGHLCRCTGYTPIVRAALEAAAEMAGDVNRETSDA